MTAIPTLVLALALIAIFYAQSGQMPAFALAIPAPARRAGRQVANILGAISAAYGTPESYGEREARERQEREDAARARAALRVQAANTTTAQIEARIERAKQEVVRRNQEFSKGERDMEAAIAAVNAKWEPRIAAAFAISAKAAKTVKGECADEVDAECERRRRIRESAKAAVYAAEQELHSLNKLLAERKRIDSESAEQAEVARAEAAAMATEANDKRAAAAEIAAARAAGVTALAIVGSHADEDAQRGSDVDAVVVYADRTPAAIAAATAVVRRWARQHGASDAPIELHAVHRPFNASKAPIALIEGPIPTEAPDLSDPGTALRAAAMAAHEGKKVKRVAVEALSSARPDTLANALAYCARRGVQVAELTTFAGKPFAG